MYRRPNVLRQYSWVIHVIYTLIFQAYTWHSANFKNTAICNYFFLQDCFNFIYFHVDKKEDGIETTHRDLVTFKSSNTFNLTYKVHSEKATKIGVILSKAKTKRKIFFLNWPFQNIWTLVKLFTYTRSMLNLFCLNLSRLVEKSFTSYEIVGT